MYLFKLKGERYMVFDYKKEYKAFYMPKNTPSIVENPKMKFLAVKGEKDAQDPIIKKLYIEIKKIYY